MPAASLTVVAAALIAAATRWWLARLPEPEVDVDEHKIPYAELARPVVPTLAMVVLAALLAAVAAWQLPPVLLPAWAVVAGVAPVLAYVDLRTHLLPYLIVAPTYLAVWALTLGVAISTRDTGLALAALIGNVVVFAVFWILYVIAGRFLAGGFGYGDVRLSAVLGVLLGPLGASATFVGIYAGFVIAAIAGVIRNRGRVRGGPPVAFGPAMVVGAFVAVFV